MARYVELHQNISDSKLTADADRLKKPELSLPIFKGLVQEPIKSISLTQSLQLLETARINSEDSIWTILK